MPINVIIQEILPKKTPSNNMADSGYKQTLLMLLGETQEEKLWTKGWDWILSNTRNI